MALNRYFFVLFLFLVKLPVSSAASDPGAICPTLNVAMEAGDNLSAALIQDAMSFAKENGLPTRVIDVGPKGFVRRRLLVAVDVTDEELLSKYHHRYHLESKISHGDNTEIAGTLAIEFEPDPGEDTYVSGVLRTSKDRKDRIWRWGAQENREPRSWESWFGRYGGDRFYRYPISGFNHIIPLDEKRLANVKTYLNNPNLRAPCSDNCVAWISSIELGRTATDADDYERDYLFGYLGMSRSQAHFEIGRRLIHAANQKHSVIVVYVKGEEGYDAFTSAEPEKFLPPPPKIPYENVIKNYKAVNPEANKAMALINDGDKVFLPIAAGASPEGFGALIDRARTLDNGVDVHVLVNGLSATAFREAANLPNNRLKIHALFLGGNLRKLHSEGKVHLIPGNLADFTRHVKQGHESFAYDAIIVRVSEPDGSGYHSLGPNHDHIMSIIKARPDIKIIAEINPAVPFTNGSNMIHAKDIAATFHSEAELAGPAVVPYTDVERRIGENLASLIDDGATLQLGIGNVFGGLADGMEARASRNITIRTEMFGDPMMMLMKRGIAKEALTGFAYGSNEMYQWLNGNKNVTFEATEVVNNPSLISQINKFHAVNTALQVNLYGEVNATMGPDGKRFSSPGGQVEFMTAASRAPNGKAIIAIRSTAKNDELSTIVLDLYPGPITTPHESVSHVVTEYGIANLSGRTERERAVALINVAHPKFRGEVFRSAVSRGLLSEEDLNLISRD